MRIKALCLLGLVFVLCSCARAPIASGAVHYSYASRGVGGGTAAITLSDPEDDGPFAGLLEDELGRLGSFDRVVRLPAGSGQQAALDAGAVWLFTADVVKRTETRRAARVFGRHGWAQPTLEVYLECRELPGGQVAWSAQGAYDGNDRVVAAAYAAFVESREVPEEPGIAVSLGARTDDYSLGRIPIDGQRFARFCIAAMLEDLPGQ